MSIFVPRVYRESFGMFCSALCQILYPSPSVFNKGKSLVDNFPLGGGITFKCFSMRIQLNHRFADIISLDNLLQAYAEFVNGKRNKPDVQAFGRNLMDNLSDLHEELKNKTYHHGPYHAFSVADPKPRSIHKANVRDRVLHHAIYRMLYPFFDNVFIYDSYSCRQNKGTHKALDRFKLLAHRVSNNHARTVWILKGDVRKFFASVDQEILLGILSTYIRDSDIFWLLKEILQSFYSTVPGKGLPLGNLTSQLLVNIYMHEFDYYVKHFLKAKQYIRYADDFVFLSDDRQWLEEQIPKIEVVLEQLLRLSLHPDKVYIRSIASGVDFLGWVHFPEHRTLRSATARRMIRRVQKSPKPPTINSYLGLLQHGNSYELTNMILNDYGLWGMDI